MGRLSLKTTIEANSEKEFHIRSIDFHRKPMKQIGNGIFDIKDHYKKKGNVNFIPAGCQQKVEKYCNQLLSFRFSTFFGNIESFDSDQHEANIFSYESFAVAFGLQTAPLSQDHILDILVVCKNAPAFLFTVTQCESSEAEKYSVSLSREVESSLHRFVDEDFHFVSGVVTMDILENRERFENTVRGLVEDACAFLAVCSIYVGTEKYDKIITAVFASLCECKSVFDDSEYIHFLTKDQGIIFIESLNSSDVSVISTPKSGSTTLMIEVARRLAVKGKTLIVCRTKEEEETIKRLHEDTVCNADLQCKSEDFLNDFHAIVHEIERKPCFKNFRKQWSFCKDVAVEERNLKPKNTTFIRPHAELQQVK